jgi:8-oxo-dGTP diphosphatase
MSVPDPAPDSVPRTATESEAQPESGPESAPGVIVIVASVIVDADGRLLLVRKRGTDSFMQAGGKPDPGEAPRDALVRELHEELGLVVDPVALHALGRFHAPAANESGWVVDAEVFRVPASVAHSSAVASAEIEELAWVTRAEAASMRIAPLTSDVLAPVMGDDWH